MNRTVHVQRTSPGWIDRIALDKSASRHSAVQPALQPELLRIVTAIR